MFATMKLTLALAALACVPTLVHAQCIQDHRPDKQGGIVIDTLVVNGPTTVSSSDMAGLEANFTGSCFRENTGELGELIKDQFQQLGYYKAKVQNLNIKPNDPLAIPKRVTVAAEVEEGPLHTLSDLEFEGNHVFTAESLKAQFPLKPGDVFNTARVRSGLEALKKLYGSEGYLDFTGVPNLQINSDATVFLRMAITEGKQYRMGKLQIVGPEEQAARLQLRWSLQEGAPFDESYAFKFMRENEALLPFHEIYLARNCREATVTVVIPLEKRFPEQGDVGCEKERKQ